MPTYKSSAGAIFLKKVSGVTFNSSFLKFYGHIINLCPDLLETVTNYTIFFPAGLLIVSPLTLKNAPVYILNILYGLPPPHTSSTKETPLVLVLTMLSHCSLFYVDYIFIIEQGLCHMLTEQMWHQLN